MISELDQPPNRIRGLTPLRPESYYLILGLVQLILLGLGFSRTFFLAPWYQSEPIHWKLLVHGVAMASWFLLFAVQAFLVVRRQRGWHRLVGWVGAGVGGLAFLSGLAVTFGQVLDRRRAGRNVWNELDRFADVVWSNLSSLLVFGVLVGAALGLRRHPPFHQRFILLGSLCLLNPALSRIGVLPEFAMGSNLDGNTFVFTWLVPVLLPLTLFGYDWRNLKRIHQATGLGVPSVILLPGMIARYTPQTEWGLGLIRWLAGVPLDNPFLFFLIGMSRG